MTDCSPILYCNCINLATVITVKKYITTGRPAKVLLLRTALQQSCKSNRDTQLRYLQHGNNSGTTVLGLIMWCHYYNIIKLSKCCIILPWTRVFIYLRGAGLLAWLIVKLICKAALKYQIQLIQMKLSDCLTFIAAASYCS